jgi:hypothetical protein
VRWPPDCVDVSPEAGERPLVKIQQTMKTLSMCRSELQRLN